MSAPEKIREIVRRRYADAATRSAAGDHEGAIAVETSCCAAAPVATTDLPAAAAETSCCGPAPVALTDKAGRIVFGAGIARVSCESGPGWALVAPELLPEVVVAGVELAWELQPAPVRTRAAEAASPGQAFLRESEVFMVVYR